MTHSNSAPESDEAAVLLGVLDDLSPGVFVVAPDLSVIATNRAADELLAEREGIVLNGNHLRIGQNGRQDELARAVARAATSPSPAGAWTYVTAIISARHPVVHVYVRGLTAKRVVVYMIDAAPAKTPDAELLRTMYRFSPAEIRVVTELLQGHSVETVAEVLSLSVHTVRAHLKNLFAKTGVRRQGELVHLIASSLGCLRGETRNPSFEGCEKADERLDSTRSSDSSGVC